MQRKLHGQTQFNRPSRFINEIPRYLLKMNAANSKSSGINKYRTTDSDLSSSDNAYARSNQTSQASYKPYTAAAPKQFAGTNLGTLDYKVGDTVKHIKFGTGVVTDITKGGKDYEVTVEFENFGVRKLLSTFAKLIKID